MNVNEYLLHFQIPYYNDVKKYVIKLRMIWYSIEMWIYLKI